MRTKIKPMKMGKCPVCGVGTIPVPTDRRGRTRISEVRKAAVRAMSKAGYGVREIQRALGYGSPNSVHLILKGKK